LQATDFTFGIPSGSTIDGITVSFDETDGGSAEPTEQSSFVVQLLKGGTSIGTPKTINGVGTGTLQLGNNIDLWGASFLDTDINASGFGFQVKAVTPTALSAWAPGTYYSPMAMIIDSNGNYLSGYNFGWDITPSIVAAAMVPSYKGKSTYLLMTKYNNYAGINTGDGHNRIAILDPNAAQNDPVIPSTQVMKAIISKLGVTPDPNFPNFPGAVREWCINTAAVDPFTKSVIVNSEDGKLYRWNLTTNKLSEAITLSGGIGEAYTPTVIGSDGTVYGINDAVLSAVGK